MSCTGSSKKPIVYLYRSSISVQTPLELKTKEPELNAERTDRDYKVHFHQDKAAQSDVNKNFKTSGPVCPDTIRYQYVHVTSLCLLF